VIFGNFGLKKREIGRKHDIWPIIGAKMGETGKIEKILKISQKILAKIKQRVIMIIE